MYRDILPSTWIYLLAEVTWRHTEPIGVGYYDGLTGASNIHHCYHEFFPAFQQQCEQIQSHRERLRRSMKRRWPNQFIILTNQDI